MTGWKMWEHGVPESRLIVIKQMEDYVDGKGVHASRWLCKCNCGNEKDVIAIGRDIRRGHIKSCGCYNIEKIIERNTRYNEFSDKMSDEHGDYYIGYTSNTHKEFYIDAEDFDIIKCYCWTESKTANMSTLITIIDGHTVRMHKLIGCAFHDHKDRNELNNRKYNLRPCTQQENSRNRSKASNNTSGIIGVNFDKRKSKWRAYISVNKKQQFLGYFDNKDDAICARLKAEKDIFGAFAPQEQLYNQYGVT